jgi:predicted DNA-binding transcriptional regulator AlpA
MRVSKHAGFVHSFPLDSPRHIRQILSCNAHTVGKTHEEFKMTSNADVLLIPADLPDHAVLSKPQVCSLIGLSEDTLHRLHRNGDGPERIQLSARRVGYSVGAIRSWLQKRSDT